MPRDLGRGGALPYRPQPMGTCRLSAADLACRRGDRLLFARLSFALESGAALQLAGSNGIGKSSLIRILAGLHAPFAGSVSREGAIALLDERPALDPHLPLGRALGFWQGIDGPADNDAVRLGLSDLMDVPVRYLSTGQRKRAALARVLGQGAPVWLLDEPLSGLDTASQGVVSELVREHCAAGGIALIASHQPLGVPGMTSFAIEDFAPSEAEEEA